MLVLAEQRAKQLKDNYNFPNAGVYDPKGVGGTGVIYVLHDATQPELYGGVSSNTTISLMVKLWEGALKWVWEGARGGGVVGVLFRLMWFGGEDRGEAAHEGGR